MEMCVIPIIVVVELKYSEFFVKFQTVCQRAGWGLKQSPCEYTTAGQGHFELLEFHTIIGSIRFVVVKSI